MGGSGGFFNGYKNEDRIRQMFAEAVTRTRNESFETDVAARLNDLLVQYNDRDADKTKAYLDRVKALIRQDIEGTVDLKFGGSIQKHTYVDGLSDVDCLVHLKDAKLRSMSPREVLEYFRGRLSQRLGRFVQVRTGKMAVTLVYPDGTEIQLVPAIATGAGLSIPGGRNDAWSGVVRPDRFAQKLTEVNQSSTGKVIPTIKLVKASLQQVLPERVQLTG